MSDTWLSLTILIVSFFAGWWFVRWDQKMETRHRQKLDDEIVDIVRRKDG